jgi:hypothetical protein
MQGTATQWLPVICQGTGGIGVDDIMPLVSYAVAPLTGAVCTSHRTTQVTVPLPKYNGPTPRHLPRKFPYTGLASGAAVVLLLLTAPAADAQRVLGPWEDATIAPPGRLRAGITLRFEQWKERLSRFDGSREALGADLSPDSLGTSVFPFIAGLSPALTVLTGNPSPPLSLGMLRTHVDVTQTTTPISLEYGLTSKLGVQVVIPYVKNRVHVLPNVNPNGIGGTLGFNPARTVAGARQQNELVTSALGTAASTLAGELARCQGSSDASCTAINADRTGATALVQTATDVSTALAAVYGTQAVAGGLYAPVAGGALHTAVDTRLNSLNTQFRAFLGAPTSGEWINGRPVAAVPLAAAGLAELLGDPQFGILARPLADYEHSHVGDIEVGAKFKLIDTFGPNAAAELPRFGALRVAAAGVYRLGTAQLDLSGDFTDVGTGDRQADIELRGYADLALGPRLWTSAVLRFALQQPDRLFRRITDDPRQPFPELAREVEVNRDLGDVMEFEFAPRYVPNDEFEISGIYRFRNKGADSYSGTFQVFSIDGTPLTLDASTLGIASGQKEHLLGFAVTYSTVRANARRSAKWPLELWYMHTQVSGGRGVPRMQMNGIGLRLYR